MKTAKFARIVLSLVLLVALAITGLVLASDVDVAVVDVTTPTGAVTLAPGENGPITINMSVTGKQEGTATFEVYQTWTLSGGAFVGSNPIEFSVPPRAPNDAPTTFTASGTINVASGQTAGTFNLSVGVFDITNSNKEGAKLSAGDPSNYQITVNTPPLPADTTPPAIAYVLNPAGPDGINSWYRSNVSLTWNVTENESPASLVKIGCADQTVAIDGTFSFSCSATSTGGTAAPVTVSIQRDTTPPTITFANKTEPNAAGWNSSDVIANWSCSDSGSGVAASTASQTLATEGANQSVIGTCTDNAGNIATNTISGINIDKTAPSAVLSVTAGTPGTNGWYTTDVTVTTTGADDLSGVTCTGGQYQKEETVGTAFNGSCTNGAGLTTPAQPLVVKLDKSGPTNVTLTPSGTLGQNGWYVSDVSILTTGSETISAPVTCTLGQMLTVDSAGTAYNGYCTNDAGQSTGASPITVKRDVTKPAISGAPDRSANTNGWYNNFVTVSFTCDDATSGVASCTAPSTLSEGKAQSVTGTVTDNAGNINTTTVSGINIDTTPPTIAGTPDRGPNTNGWYRDAVTVTFKCDDALSGYDTCAVPVTLAAEGANQSVTGIATDKAGNSASATVGGINIDLTAPTITWNGDPEDGSSFYFGYGPAAEPTCNSVDYLSGPDGCNVTGYSTAVGPHTMTATAFDKAGNTKSETRTYTVLAWTLNGFYQPVDMSGVLNIVKNGSTVPLKFEVFAGSTELTATSTITSLTYAQVMCSPSTTDEIETVAAGSTSLRYDLTGGQFIYNWKISGTAGYCYRVTVTTQDGSKLQAYFKLK